MNSEKIKYNCPICEKEVETNIVSNINVTLNPELKDKLFSGELFLHECTNCQSKIQLNYSFLYHDLKNKFLISYGTEAKYVQELIDNLQFELSEEDFDLDQLLKIYQVRVVRDMNDLFEKIYLFEAGLDDRVIEFCKLLILDNAREEEKLQAEEIIDIRYMPKDIMEEKGNIKDDVIGMNIYCEGEKAFIRTIEMPFYNQTKNYIQELAQKNQMNDELVIDQAWINKLLEQA
ncbi:MAG: hypothetical protein GX326_00330 [Clostridiaceae bacterium]|nr:hypothetical protein [Clostridiaceae bacterium]